MSGRAAAIHRMTDTELHIHLQYYMVQASKERELEFARRVTTWKKRFTCMARQALRNEGNRNPEPAKTESGSAFQRRRRSRRSRPMLPRAAAVGSGITVTKPVEESNVADWPVPSPVKVTEEKFPE